MTSNINQKHPDVWRVAEQIAAADPGANALQSLPSSPFQIGRFWSIWSKMVPLGGATLLVALVTTILIPLLVWSVRHIDPGEGQLSKMSSEFQLQGLLVISLILTLSALHLSHRFLARRPRSTLVVVAVTASCLVGLIPVAIGYAIEDTHKSIYTVITIWGALLWIAATVIYRNRNAVPLLAPRWRPTAALLDIAVILAITWFAVAWAFMFAESTAKTIDTVQGGAEVVAIMAKESDASDGVTGAWQSDPSAFEAGILLSAFVGWAVAATVLYYRWYASLIALFRSPIPLAGIFAQIVDGIVGGANLRHPGRDPKKQRSKLLESLGKQLAAKVFGLNVVFLVSHAVAVVGRPHTALIPHAARVDILFRTCIDNGLRCAINEHLARLEQSPSGQTQGAGLTLPSETDQPVIFQTIVFVVADQLHHVARSTGNPNAGRLPESAALASRHFAERTAAAIHDSEIVSSILDGFEITTVRS